MKYELLCPFDGYDLFKIDENLIFDEYYEELECTYCGTKYTFQLEVDER